MQGLLANPTSYAYHTLTAFNSAVEQADPAELASILHNVVLLSATISMVAKEERYIPSRRTGKGPLGAKVFSYYTQDERRLIEKAAKLEHRSLSSFVAIAAVERAQRVLGRK